MSAGLPGASRPIGRPITPRGDCRGCVDRALERDAELDEVSDRLDHRQGAAGENTVLTAGDTVRDVDLDAAEAVPSVAEAGGGDRVRDERQTARRRRSQSRRTMSGSRWTPSTIACRTTSGRTSAAPTMPGSRCVERPHRVEDMGHRANAAIEGGVRLGGGRIAVPERDDDAACLQDVDQVECARKLRRQCHEPDRPASSRRSSSARSGSRRNAAGCVPSRSARDEWALEVRSENACARALASVRREARRSASSAAEVMNVGR